VNIQFENVDFNSRSGPNGFGLKLARQFHKNGHDISGKNPDIRLSFIQSSNNFNPTVLRLDGIYFNSSQDWERMNEPIKRSYDFANAIIVQSQFDKDLITAFFGDRENISVIHNGTDFELIEKISPHLDADVFPKENIWMCASSWRPHKRLDENIRLFQHLRGPNDKLVIAGANANVDPNTNMANVHFLGDLTWPAMISWMKSAGNFIHLSWLDHCPNVVIDAKAVGCKIHVSSAGGTRELAGHNDFIYQDYEFNFEPIELYNPPPFKPNFDRSAGLSKLDISISGVADQYFDVVNSLI
jgi:glycosyltransferase involved in cell wall biosynthesis